MSGAAADRGLVLALETSTRTPALAVARGPRTLVQTLAAARAHAADLLPALERMLGELGASPRELALIVVGTGPGSYTGLRVGAAIALGLARASGARLCGVPSFEAAAYEQLRPGEEGLVLQDARAGELYVARYRRTEQQLEVLLAPEVTRAGELATATLGTTVVLADDAALAAAALASPARPHCVRSATPTAAALLELGRARAARGALGSVEPLYLRPFAMRSQRR
ncbi:MAG: tRNA (adenosine(37)-N6)-threonylcarbamoyltransferase complex dimerization subunit type 1 TsaB [Planctomycetes bacterium]|nr:tRNA (adenosine(37)-N6)-threonylcarbamoyltransferase complex dimerization subunit type 1 TsaB [Planctomycetota bacterium]